MGAGQIQTLIWKQKQKVQYWNHKNKSAPVEFYKDQHIMHAYAKISNHPSIKFRSSRANVMYIEFVQNNLHDPLTSIIKVRLEAKVHN
jgi:hypothetical protein